MNNVHYSSKTVEWETPADLFASLDSEFNFTLDVCATAENTKCRRYFDKSTDGLKQSWAPEICWMNCPYGREISDWVAKAYEESLKGATVVCLLPARTDTRWFHEYVRPYGEVTFLQGRLKFGGSKNSAPFPSMLVVFSP